MLKKNPVTFEIFVIFQYIMSCLSILAYSVGLVFQTAYMWSLCLLTKYDNLMETTDDKQTERKITLKNE